jgi:beta-xylosidase
MNDRIPRSVGGRTHLPTVLVAVFVLIAAVLIYDTVTVIAVHRAQATLGSIHRQVTVDRAALSGVASRQASATAQLQLLQHNESVTISQLSSTDRTIDAADQLGAADSLDINSLDTCLSGVSDASAGIDAANPAKVLTAVTAVSSTCLTLDGTAGGLVYPFNFPDPSVLRVGTEYYAFSTNAVVGNIQVIASSNLTVWTPVGDALPQLPTWAVPGNTWHPAVLQRGGTFVLYYAVEDGVSGQECVSVAVSSQPQGPYLDSSSAPLVCQTQDGGSLDPSPYIGADGRPYLVWKSQGADGQPPALWSQQLTPTGTALVAGPPSELLAPDQRWEGGIIEGPNMLVTGGHYLLFFGGNNWQTANYAIGIADCNGPLGPCTASVANPLLASDQSMQGPGGPSLSTDTQGNLWLGFHAWLPGEVGYPNGRPLFLRRVNLSGDVPSVVP